MESEGSKRERGNSIAATNGHPNPATNSDGNSRVNPQVGETRAQNINPQANESRSPGNLGIPLSDEYGTGSPKSKSSGGISESRNDSNYESPATEISTGNNERSQTAAIEPPVTKTTLSELDVHKIVNNPKLRHDINFDPDLHFRPNLDGEKGKKKTQRANEFWETMRIQLRNYLANCDQFEKELGDAEWCLPATLKAIRGILETLVPQRDRPSVEETFNVELLMQQFRKGVADLVKLSMWLSQLLKCHCAPMRDNWVDEMVTQLSNGDRNRDVTLLVAGIQNLMGVLEAMKLDVANHQIRCLRPLLIEDTVHFEQKFFMKKIALGRVDVVGAHTWFRRASNLPDPVLLESPIHCQGNTWDFIKALVNLTLPSRSSEMVPHTFLFDEERLIKLRTDMQDLVNLEICMYLYRSLEASSRVQDIRYSAPDDTPSTSSPPSPYDRPASPTDSDMLSSPTVPHAHHFETSKPRNIPSSQERGRFIREPSGRQVWQPRLEDGHTVSAGSSPRSSPSSMSSTPDAHTPTPLYLSMSFSDSSSRVRRNLLDILASSTSNDKWASLSNSLALQILRSTITPLTHLPQFESRLAFHLSNPRSTVYQDSETRVLAQLLPILQRLVETYTPLTSLQIFEAATASKPVPAGGISHVASSKEEITEIAMRIAHIGILHWRVWAPLAYLVDPEELDIQNERPKSMP